MMRMVEVKNDGSERSAIAVALSTCKAVSTGLSQQKMAKAGSGSQLPSCSAPQAEISRSVTFISPFLS
jgi:hypothetical protein